MTVGIELRALKVSTCGLQRVEKKACGFVLDLAREQHAHDLHERDLNGIGVLEDGQDERACVAASAGVFSGEADALVMKALVKETETIAAQGGRSALNAIDFDVLTTTWILHGSYPLLGWFFRNIGLGKNCDLIYGLQ